MKKIGIPKTIGSLSVTMSYQRQDDGTELFTLWGHDVPELWHRCKRSGLDPSLLKDGAFTIAKHKGKKYDVEALRIWACLGNGEAMSAMERLEYEDVRSDRNSWRR